MNFAPLLLLYRELLCSSSLNVVDILLSVVYISLSLSFLIQALFVLVCILCFGGFKGFALCSFHLVAISNVMVKILSVFMNRDLSFLLYVVFNRRSEIVSLVDSTLIISDVY